MNIKYILTHPVQYQVPLIRYLNKNKINITVLFRSNLNTKKHFDEGFKKKIKWKTDLLNGYKYRFLNYLGTNKIGIIFPLTTDFYKGILDKSTDIIWIHNLKIWYNLLIIILAKFFNKKIFVRDEVHEFSKKRNFLNFFFNRIFYLLVNPFVDIFLAIGSKNKEYYLNNKIPKKKIVMMPYVVDNNLFSIKKKIKKNEKIQILYAGKLTKRKGVDILLESISILNKKIRLKNQYELLIVGDGEMKKFLVHFIKINNLRNVKILPFKNEKELSKIYQKSDIFIMPSYFEPWGLTVNEALASKNAVICSDKVGSSYDLVRHGINGYLFKEKNPNHLAKQINNLINNRKKIEMFKRKGFEIISNWSFKECNNGLKKAMMKVK